MSTRVTVVFVSGFWPRQCYLKEPIGFSTRKFLPINFSLYCLTSFTPFSQERTGYLRWVLSGVIKVIFKKHTGRFLLTAFPFDQRSGSNVQVPEIPQNGPLSIDSRVSHAHNRLVPPTIRFSGTLDPVLSRTRSDNAHLFSGTTLWRIAAFNYHQTPPVSFRVSASLPLCSAGLAAEVLTHFPVRRDLSASLDYQLRWLHFLAVRWVSFCSP